MRSSVPVWPMRETPSARRVSVTTSCEVGPSGLSTTSTPSGNGWPGPSSLAADGFGHQLAELLVARRERRPWPSSRRRSCARRRRERRRWRRRRRSPFDRMLTRQSWSPTSLKNATAWMSFTVSGKLIRPSRSSLVPPRSVIVCARDREQRDAALVDDHHAVHHRAENAHAGQAAAVVVGPRDPLRIGAGFDAAPRDLVGARREVREMERAGVGQHARDRRAWRRPWSAARRAPRSA